MPSDNGSIGPPGIYARRVEGGTYRHAASDIAGARAIRRASTVGAWHHIRDCPRRSGLRQVRSSGGDEPLDELQGGIGDFPPAVVDREGMASVGDLDDLGHAFVA